MNEKRASFVFRRDWRDAIAALPAQVRLEVYEAIIEYGTSGTLVELKAKARLAFGFIKQDMDAQRATETSEQGNNVKESPLVPPKEKKRQKKNNPLLSPKETPSCETREDKILTPFETWLKQHCPYIFSHYKLPTNEEVEKLKMRYGADIVAATCEKIENRTDLRKRYNNLYRTLLNWIKKDQEYATKHPDTYTCGARTSTSQQRAARDAEAAELVARLLQEDRASA